MFWKSVKDKLFPNYSITFRLTLFYTLTTSILLIAITLSLYWVMVNIIYKAEHQFLSDEIDILQHLASQREHDLPALRQEALEIPSVLDNSVYTYYIRMLDKNKDLVVQTDGIEKILNHTHFFAQNSQYIGKQSTWWHSPEGRDYLLMKSQTDLTDSSNAWEIQVALDVTYQHNVISEYRKILITTFCCGTLLALLLGYLIAYRNMRRLRDLTETTKNITATSLHQRINPESWPSELSTLGMAFNEMLDRIEYSFARLTQFSDDLAHELRTPINNLIGETEIALSHKSSIEECKQVLESNLEEFQRISHIIENLLFLARAENPKLEIKKSSLSVNAEINKIVEFYQAMADEKNIQISYTGEATLQANPVMFRRMLSNILSNAIKYTNYSGTITFIITEQVDDTVQIIVTDTGIGIASHHLPNIFNRFYRVDSARSKLSGGTGLGLAIVKSIVELHHGAITLDSEPNVGTTVTIILPK